MELLRRSAEIPWTLEDGRGNHRVIVMVKEAADYVRVQIKWRRRDLNPENTALMVRDMRTDAQICNILPVIMTREYGELIFQAPHAGEYAIYYLPYQQTSQNWWFPIVEYNKQNMQPAEEAWVKQLPAQMPEAQVVAIESRTEFDSFYPMEVPATQKEMQKVKQMGARKPFLVFPEDRKYPIRMFYELPYKWVEEDRNGGFSGEAQPNEYYTFQLGVWAQEDLKDVSIDYHMQHGDFALTKQQLTCFQTEGVDWLGKTYAKKLQIKQGRMQAIWIGVDLPKEQRGTLCFDVEIKTDRGSEMVPISITVRGENIENRGDGDLWRMSRLRWLNSTIGLDTETTEPFAPLEYDLVSNTVAGTGKSVKFDRMGMPQEMTSYFNETIQIDEKPTELLKRPMQILVSQQGKNLEWTVSDSQNKLAGSGRFVSECNLYADALRLCNRTTMEYDGHIDTFLTITAKEPVQLDNIVLQMELTPECSQYMMGLGKEGGNTPEYWQYEWNRQRTNNFVWLGGVNGGVHLKLKHTQEVWELYTYEEIGLPEGWYNQGQGGCSIRKDTGGTTVQAFTGKLTLEKDQSITLRYSLLLTPIKPMDSDAHWRDRYDHPGEEGLDLQRSIDGGATVVNLHQGLPMNRYINYPFCEEQELKTEVQRAHKMGLKLKIYDTVRELTTHTQEFWMLRSLGNEVLMDGPSFRVAEHFVDEFFNQDKSNPSTGGPWLCEHLVEGYIPAWQTIFPDKEYDCSVATVGLSRWHNYYLEGLRWLMQEVDVDGIYLDGVGYDRQIMKRVRKVMNNSKKGSLIDFHSGNNFHPAYGLCNVLGEYMELMPSVDSLWIGEGFDYEETSPDYWLVEICGIPFGLMGDMLHRGGNKWRGMLFGMTPRCNWPEGGSPLPIWNLWNDFDMTGCQMVGWWCKEPVVWTSNDKVKATAYVQQDRVMLAVASWAKEQINVTIHIDFSKLRWSEQASAYQIPKIEGFQEEELYTPGKPVTIEPAKGKIILVSFKG